MARKEIIILLLSVSIILLAYYFFSNKASCQDFNQGTININDTQSIAVNFAITPAEQAKGLSGCSSLKLGQGMYFRFSQKTNAVFWMKDMIIPIDIIWISDNKVIGIEYNVPPPNDDTLIKYHAPRAVDAVLELGAGHAAQLQITKNTTIQVQEKNN